MKKSVVLLIGLVYIISVVVVGVVGIKMRIYNETIYVNDIECSIRGYDEPTKDYEYGGVIYNYYYTIEDCTPNVTFEIQSNVIPSNATNAHVRYYMDKNDNVTLETNENNNVALVTFKEEDSITIHVSAIDGGSSKEKLILLDVYFTSKELGN